MYTAFILHSAWIYLASETSKKKLLDRLHKEGYDRRRDKIKIVYEKDD